jgi:hypothetical protein
LRDKLEESMIESGMGYSTDCLTRNVIVAVSRMKRRRSFSNIFRFVEDTNSYSNSKIWMISKLMWVLKAKRKSR